MEPQTRLDDLDVTFQSSAANSGEETFGDPEALARAIQALPPGQRQAVELLKLRELSLISRTTERGTGHRDHGRARRVCVGHPWGEQPRASTAGHQRRGMGHVVAMAIERCACEP